MRKKLIVLSLTGIMALGFGTGTFARTIHHSTYHNTYHSTSHKYNHGKLQIIKRYRNGDILYTQHNCKGSNGKFKKLVMCGR